MKASLTLAATLSLLALGSALAQDIAQDVAERRALQRALASVNEDGPERPALPRRGAGFFGDGFFVATDRVATGIGAQRFGGREEIDAFVPREAVGDRLYTR